MTFARYIVIFVFGVFFLSSCKEDLDMNLVQKTLFEDSALNAIDADGPWEITVQQDERCFVELEYSAFMESYFVVNCEGNELDLKITTSSSLPYGTECRAIVHLNTLRKIELSRACVMRLEGAFTGLEEVDLETASKCIGGSFTGNELEMELTDASELLDFGFEGNKVKAELNDASVFRGQLNPFIRIDLEIYHASVFVNYDGSSAKANVTVKNASVVNLGRTIVNEVDFTCNSASTATFNVTEWLRGSVTEGSEVFYYGNPQVDVDCDVSSSLVRL